MTYPGVEGIHPALESLPEIKLHPPGWPGTCHFPAEPYFLGLPGPVSTLKGLVLSWLSVAILGPQCWFRGFGFFALMRPSRTGNLDPVRE